MAAIASTLSDAYLQNSRNTLFLLLVVLFCMINSKFHAFI